MESLTIVAVLVGAYLLGAVPSGLLIARAYGVPDIRAHGSGNIGATNVWRTIGPRAAVWVYVADIGKGVAAVLVARQIHTGAMNHDLFLVFTTLAVVVGNIFPVYLKFRGGKGVNTSLGAFVVLLTWQTLVCLGIFLVVVTLTRYISLGSMIAASCLFVILILEKYVFAHEVAPVYLILTGFMAAVILLTHRRNVGRLISGTESKFSLSTKSKGADSRG